MSDRPDDENEAADDVEPPTREGVRILGADEAQAVIESGHSAPRKSGDQPKFGDVPPRPDPSVRPAARFPRPQAEASETGAPHEPEQPPLSWSASDEGLAPRDPSPPETSGPVELPHWSEPPSGEVPVILPEASVTDDDEDLEAWSTFATGGQPRFRGGAEDWAAADFQSEALKADFESEGLEDEATGLGALAEPVDDDEEFDAQVAARRARRVGAGSRQPRARARRPERIPADEQPESFDDAGAPPPDLQVRLISAGIMVIVALVCFWLGRGATAVLAALIVGLAALELFEGLRRRGLRPATVLGLLGSVALVLVAYEQGTAAYPMVFALVVVFSLCWYMAEVVRARPVPNLGATLLTFAYVGGLGGFAGLLLAAPNGIGLIVGVALCAIAYDVAGYFIGSQFGKRPLLPRISPHKTVEGLVGGMIAAVAVGFLTSTLLGLTPWDGKGSYGLWLGVVVAITAPLGDLFESMLKRDLGLKDLGTVLPGHGGVLDRFDGLLISLPAAYYLVLHLGIS